jgi:branched-subunit amino acid ABC-type transport system permease component
MTFDALVYQGLIGVSLAMYLWLLAAGLTIAFGVLGVVNFAHGSLYMLGGYLAFTFYETLGVNFWLSLLLAAAGGAAIGGVMERFFLRHIYHLDLAYQILLTFGFVLIFADAARIFWGGIPLIPPMPDALDATVSVVGRPFPLYNLFVIVFGLAASLLLWALLDRTSFGETVRASAADREMAGALGVNIPRVFTVVFAFASLLAALSGALGTPVRAMTPGVGTSVIIDVFIVTVIGGLGNLPGAFAGALVIGLMKAYGVLLFPDADLFMTYLIMALVLLFRPKGLLGGR